MPSNVQVYIVGVVRDADGRVTIDVHNSKRLEHMTFNAMKVNRPHMPSVELEAVEVYS